MPIAIAMQRGKWRDSFSTLRIANYRKYAASQGISNIAGWAMRVATDWLVLELTGNIALVGLTIAIQFAPLLLFGAWGGVIADRFPKRAMLVFTQLAASLISAVLAVLTITGVVQLWMIYVLVALMGIVQLLDNPSRSVFVSEIVGPRQLRNAISLNASIFHLGALVGPALSGIAIVAVGSGWSIAANAVAAAIGAILIGAIRQDQLLTAPRAPKAKGQIREAARYVLAKPAMFWTFVMVTFVSMFGLPLPTLLAGMADTVFETGAQGYGLYNSLLAVGALTGALLSTRRTELRLRTIVLGAMLYGVLQTLVGLAPFYSLVPRAARHRRVQPAALRDGGRDDGAAVVEPADPRPRDVILHADPRRRPSHRRPDHGADRRDLRLARRGRGVGWRAVPGGRGHLDRARPQRTAAPQGDAATARIVDHDRAEGIRRRSGVAA